MCMAFHSDFASSMRTAITLICPYRRIKHAFVETHNSTELLYFLFMITTLSKFLFHDL